MGNGWENYLKNVRNDTQMQYHSGFTSSQIYFFSVTDFKIFFMVNLKEYVTSISSYMK